MLVCEAKVDLVRLVLARQKDTESRSTDAAADIAHEAGNARDLVVLFARHADVVQRADGNKNQRHEDHLEHAQQDDGDEIDLEIDVGHQTQREGRAQESNTDQKTRIDFGRSETAGHNHHEHQHKARGRERQPGSFGRVAQAALQKFGNQDGGTEQDHSQARTRSETAVPKLRFLSRRTSTIGIGVIPLPEEERDERRKADAG